MSVADIIDCTTSPALTTITVVRLPKQQHQSGCHTTTTLCSQIAIEAATTSVKLPHSSNNISHGCHSSDKINQAATTAATKSIRLLQPQHQSDCHSSNNISQTATAAATTSVRLPQQQQPHQSGGHSSSINQADKAAATSVRLSYSSNISQATTAAAATSASLPQQQQQHQSGCHSSSNNISQAATAAASVRLPKTRTFFASS